jgi:hypothetical protein
MNDLGVGFVVAVFIVVLITTLFPEDKNEHR